ncbi:hypothetical protein, partial [Rhodococcus sp. NPDC060084]|uniref:hypothetical protein n=1 Tax=Rhodococcus sp. NPDC060084 TaxID=3347053 RepID=UPI0036637862
TGTSRWRVRSTDRLQVGIGSRTDRTDYRGPANCFAHDQLITLATLDKTGAMTQGQRALAIGIGANHLFSSTVLRKL